MQTFKRSNALWLIAAALPLLACLTAASRGAWLALAGAAGLWATWRGLCWWTARRGWDAERAWQTRLRVMGGLVLLALPVLVWGVLQVLSGPAPVAGVLASRLDLLRGSWLLARDHLFSGAGLGMFPMQFSIYTLLIPVLFITHSHNLLMDILIEQGLLGLIAFVWLAAAGIVLALRRLRYAAGNAAWIIEAGLASLLIVLAHGLVDDALYGSRALVLLLVPFGLVMAVGNGQPPFGRMANGQRSTFNLQPLTFNQFSLVTLLALAVVFAAIAWRPLLAAFYANLGALEQSRVELGHYDQEHWDNPTLDQVRQQNDLDEAIRLLQQAVQTDPANLTARQRLAAILLSRGQYEQALEHVQAAWDAGQRDSVTRLLLGDAYAANGQPGQSAEVVRDLRWAEGRMAGYAWYRYWLAQDYQRAADAWAAVVLLNPDNQQAVTSQAEAARRAGEKR